MYSRKISLKVLSSDPRIGNVYNSLLENQYCGCFATKINKERKGVDITSQGAQINIFTHVQDGPQSPVTLA